MNLAALSALVKGDMNNFIAASTPGGIEHLEPHPWSNNQ